MGSTRQQSFDNAAKLFVAVRTYAAARGVEAALDEDKSSVVLRRL